MKNLFAALSLMTLAILLQSPVHATSRTPETYCENGPVQVFVYNDQAFRQVVVKENNLITFESEIELAHHRYGVVYTAKGLTLTVAGELTVEGYEGFLNSATNGIKVLCRTQLGQ